MNEVLNKLGLSKESVAKLLNTPVSRERKTTTKYRTRRWNRVPEDLKKKILKEHKTRTHKELSVKYDMSISMIYCIRTGKTYRHKLPKTH